ncbi:DUF4399 domain-containing protein [Bosea sp. WAO]|uniref:DUF4399 domain-containing protein n=1 Tax=Bosea sp. WAO TaxID=406341 RepID=UPI000A9CA3D0|nr:DUF4399 domain-containing protein [Bosea sp. WAO]
MSRPVRIAEPPASFRMRRLTALACLALLCPLLAATAPSAQTAQRQPSPRGALLYFHYPLDGLRVPERFTVRMGLKEMGVAPAGIDKPLTGHHHLLIDVEPPPPDQPIPADYNHIHLGNGQTEVVVTLPKGTHTLQLLLGDHLHTPHQPPVMSQKITVYVR